MSVFRNVCRAFVVAATVSATPAFADCKSPDKDEFYAHDRGLIDAFTGIDESGNLITLRLRSAFLPYSPRIEEDDPVEWQVVLTNPDSGEGKKICRVLDGESYSTNTPGREISDSAKSQKSCRDKGSKNQNCLLIEKNIFLILLQASVFPDAILKNLKIVANGLCGGNRPGLYQSCLAPMKISIFF